MKQTIIRFLRIGVGIASTDVEYADSTSPTEAPTSGWQTTAPKWVSGHFVWSRTHIYYTDGREHLSDPVCLPTGKGIASIVEQYYKSTSSTRCTGGSWSDTAPTWQTGYYIFTRSVIYYTDGTSFTTQPICATGSKGDKGDKGDPGKDGANGTSVTIKGSLPNTGYLPTSGATKGDGYIIDGDLWVYTDSSKSGAVYGFENVGKIQGPQGDPGKPGTSATQYYYHIAWCNTPDNSDGSFAIALNDGEAYAYMGYCIDVNEVDPDRFDAYTWVKVKGEQGVPGKDGNDGKDGKDGADGKDAVTITMSLSAIVHHKSANSTRYSSLVKVFEGSEQVNFEFAKEGSADGLTVTSVPKGKSRYFYFEIAGGAIVNTSVKIDIVYKGISYARYILVTTVADGEPGNKGDRGAVLRGPQLWTNCGEGYCFEAGEDGKEWKDTVIYNNSTYSCIKSHVKTTTNYPGSDEDINNGYWRVGSPIELIVANIIMSRYQLVKNLGVETIEMLDADGNVIFQAKDGNVLANKGTFNNIVCDNGNFTNAVVTGDLNLSTLRYLANEGYNDGTAVMAKAFNLGYGPFILPHLNDNECMRVVIFNPIISRSSQTAKVSCQGGNDVLKPASGTYNLTSYRQIEVSGWCEMIGSNLASGKTTWIYRNIVQS